MPESTPIPNINGITITLTKLNGMSSSPMAPTASPADSKSGASTSSMSSSRFHSAQSSSEMSTSAEISDCWNERFVASSRAIRFTAIPLARGATAATPSTNGRIVSSPFRSYSGKICTRAVPSSLSIRPRSSSGSESIVISPGSRASRSRASWLGRRARRRSSSRARAWSGCPSVSRRVRKVARSSRSRRMLAPRGDPLRSTQSASRKSRSRRSASICSSTGSGAAPPSEGGGGSSRKATSARISRFSSWSVGT